MKNSLLIINLVVILTIAASFFFGKQEFNKLKQSYAELNENNLSLASQEQSTRLLEKTAADRKIISLAIITAEDLPDFIEQLENLATETGAEINLARVDDANENNPNINLDFDLNGSYQSLAHFTLLLESLPFQIRIDQIAFNRNSVTENKKSLPTWRAHFTIELLNSQTKK
ncbi:hypothetical protein IT398_00980 [Candidatus Nomurabacteria bacterium]|nr:hypothetical protein [Candidatus Nomurabacteria bacterium]